MDNALWSRYEYQEVERLILAMYRLKGYGLDPEECRSAAYLEYTEVRTRYYEVRMNPDYWKVVAQSICQAFAKMKKERDGSGYAKRNPSLNAVKEGFDETVEAFLYCPQGDFVNGIVFWDYLFRLGRKKYKLARLITQKEDDLYIMEKMRLDKAELEQLKSELCQDMLSYIEN